MCKLWIIIIYLMELWEFKKLIHVKDELLCVIIIISPKVLAIIISVCSARLYIFLSFLFYFLKLGISWGHRLCLSHLESLLPSTISGRFWKKCVCWMNVKSSVYLVDKISLLRLWENLHSHGGKNVRSYKLFWKGFCDLLIPILGFVLHKYLYLFTKIYAHSCLQQHFVEKKKQK